MAELTDIDKIIVFVARDKDGNVGLMGTGEMVLATTDIKKVKDWMRRVKWLSKMAGIKEFRVVEFKRIRDITELVGGASEGGKDDES